MKNIEYNFLLLIVSVLIGSGFVSVYEAWLSKNFLGAFFICILMFCGIKMFELLVNIIKNEKEY